MTNRRIESSETESENEKAVIRALLNNARKSTMEIAKEVGVTRQTVAKIIKRLEDDGRIWGYIPVMEPELLGNHFYLVLIKVKEDVDVGEMIKKIATFSDSEKTLEKGTKLNFKCTAYLHGRFNYSTGFYAPNIVEAEKIVNKMIKPYRKYISELYIHQTLISFRSMGFINPHLAEDIKGFF